jgi:glucose/arabinose dehydrogenase
LGRPWGLAFNSSGDLFVADETAGNIYEYTPNGTQSTFATGLDHPFGLAFNSSGNLFEADSYSATIYEFTANGTKSTFATGLSAPQGLAFFPIPEPATLTLLGAALLGFGMVYLRRRGAR